MQTKTRELFDLDVPYLSDLFNEEYPWQIIPKIKTAIDELIKSPPSGFTHYKDGVLIGQDVKISPLANVQGPTIIGHGTEIRTGAYIRGSVIIGRNCVIGNSSELKNCVLLNNVQVPHYNYVGDSILGNYSHMGAGSVLSNLKSDHKCVIIHADGDFETGLRKLGSFLGDGADIGCGCVLNPGTVVGRGTRVYPLTSVRGVIPHGCIVKSAKEIVTIEER